MNSGMVVAGVMSGTSADGINVALVRMRPQKMQRARSDASARDRRREQPGSSLRAFELIGYAEYPYPTRVRSAILAAMNALEASVADLARLNFLLGELFSEAVLSTQRRFQTRVNLVGCHGQTLYHQGQAATFLGHKISATWQTGEGAVIATRVGVPVISDFRPADVAAGGKGAPLVPFLDYLLFRTSEIGRIVQNIGGIANLTAIPANCTADQVVAFDTGPGNMVIDAVTENLFGRRFDAGGQIAARGKVIEPVVTKILRNYFFREKPPKTAGREEFGREFVTAFLRRCACGDPEDAVATATALTAKSIALAIDRFVIRRSGRQEKMRFRELILSGGGAKNRTLVSMLGSELAALEIQIRSSDEFGIPSDAKEAVAFAVLTHETWHRRPSNIPSATGAKRASVLGKISYP